jgi:hypothetical protein
MISAVVRWLGYACPPFFASRSSKHPNCAIFHNQFGLVLFVRGLVTSSIPIALVPLTIECRQAALRYRGYKLSSVQLIWGSPYLWVPRPSPSPRCEAVVSTYRSRHRQCLWILADWKDCQLIPHTRYKSKYSRIAFEEFVVLLLVVIDPQRMKVRCYATRPTEREARISSGSYDWLEFLTLVLEHECSCPQVRFEAHW